MQAEARLDSTSVVLQRTELLRVPVCLGTEDTHWARLYGEHREDRFSKLFHLQAEAGNEFVCRRKKQGKLNQPNYSEHRSKSSLSCTAKRNWSKPQWSQWKNSHWHQYTLNTAQWLFNVIPCAKQWKQRRDSLHAESRRTQKEADEKLSVFLGRVYKLSDTDIALNLLY